MSERYYTFTPPDEKVRNTTTTIIYLNEKKLIFKSYKKFNFIKLI